MEIVQYVLIVVEILASILLATVVLLQSGKEAGLSGALAGNTETYMSKNKRAGFDKLLASSTKWVALAWVVITFALVLVIKAV